MLLRLAITVVCLSTQGISAADFVDPAPPVVAALKGVDAPAPKAQPELVFHAAPKALPAGAVTADSPGFLGVNHSPLSPETKLTADLTKLPLVWECGKGAGYAAPAVAGD